MKLSRMSFTAVCIVCAAAISTVAQTVNDSQQPQAKETKKVPNTEHSRRPLQLVSVVDDARLTPPEFAADTLIKLASSDRVADKEWKGELLEEAFQLATRARHPVKLIYIGGDIDTREGYLSYAMDARLDGLSLQTRAAEAMLVVDKLRARALLSEIPPGLNLRPLSCEDSVAYDVSAFYNALRDIADKSFSPSERLAGVHVQFVEPYVMKIVSPAQVGPVAKMIASLSLSPTELATLSSAFADGLKNVAEDDRSLAASLTVNSLVEQFRSLLDVVGKQGQSRAQLGSAFRDLLMRSLGGRRCADRAEASRRKLLSNYITSLNKTYPELGPLAADDIKPLEVRGNVRTHPYWRSVASRNIQGEIKQLRFNNGSKEISDGERGDAAWQNSLSKLLNDLADWDERAEESAEDYFHQKSVAYQSLIEIVPAGSARDSIISDFVRFLSSQPIEREDPAAWYLHAKYILDYARKANGEEQRRILKVLKDSNDPTLRLYSELDRMLPSHSVTAKLAVGRAGFANQA